MKLQAHIDINSTIVFEGEEKNKLKNFRTKNVGKEITVSFELGFRSIKQHRLYWGCVKAILFFANENYKFINKDYLHKWLENQYALLFKEDSFKKVKIFGSEELICSYSISFDKCTHEEFQKYIEFVDKKCEEITGFKLDEIIDEYKKQVAMTDDFDYMKEIKN